ncbi:MAG: hypothetical protein EOS18_06210 [Mesorhizobium sp.]|nr:MAG: hypothetical protein EOS18_06210 [Mesorhizobium sp.]
MQFQIWRDSFLTRALSLNPTSAHERGSAFVAPALFLFTVSIDQLFTLAAFTVGAALQEQACDDENGDRKYFRCHVTIPRF